MSSMKNQISEVIKEDLNESIRSNTGRNTPLEDSFRKKDRSHEESPTDYIGSSNTRSFKKNKNSQNITISY